MDNHESNQTNTPAFTLTPGKWHENLYAPGLRSRDETAPGMCEVIRLMQHRDECERKAREFLDTLPDTIVRYITFKMLTAAGLQAVTCSELGKTPLLRGMQFGLRWILDEAGISTFTGNTTEIQTPSQPAPHPPSNSECEELTNRRNLFVCPVGDRLDF